MNIPRPYLTALSLAWSLLPAMASAQDQPATPDDAAAKQAAEFLQTVISEMRVSGHAGGDKTLRPRMTPILRYSDPARIYPAAGLWRLGETGRPPLLVSLEYWTRAETDEPRIMFEFISFTDQKLELKADAQTTWRGDGGSATFAQIEDGPKPSATEKQRLLQMRSLARRFSASEKHMGDPIDLRLLPQPLDRYTDKEHGVEDAAIFVFAYGTNPELVMLLEDAAGSWRYGLMRMSWAELSVRLDDREVARFEQLGAFPTKGAYQTAGHVTKSLIPTP
jgi:hypothetical protein